MGIKLRKYTNECGITEDYSKVRRFIIKRGYCEYTYARWDWMATHSCLERESVSSMGLWEDKGELVAAALFDCQIGEIYLITLPGYEYLRKEMIIYALDVFGSSEYFCIVIPDADIAYQNDAAECGLVASPDKEFDTAYYSNMPRPHYTLPEGFSITDLSQTFDLYQYERVLWKGFNHEIDKEGLYDESGNDGSSSAHELLRPNVDLSLKIAAVAPDGNFCAYCGMWYDSLAGYAVIEPVACDPDYRRMGLGRAVVSEGICRILDKGASFASVVSSQQFYYSIGMRPHMVSTKWKQRSKNR